MSKLIKRRGFTLVEMMVVVAFIGILVTTMLINYQGTMKKARDDRRLADATSIKQAANMYADRTGSYPSTGGANYVCSHSTAGLGDCRPADCAGGGATTTWASLTTSLVDFINLGELKDPQLGTTDRCYRYRSNGGNCVIAYYSEAAGAAKTITCK